MKLYNVKDVNEFFKVIDSCKGTVMLVSPEGDRLNLKSKLSQFVSFSSFFSTGSIPELEIVAYEPEDTKRILDYMLTEHNDKD
ncbi:MAG: polya polymerase [Lachnospiraceae bacterium]|nr:polya polymerase [Lachnospiraceae bacterium]